MNFKPEQIQTVPELKGGYPNVENVGNTSSLTASFLGKEIDLLDSKTTLEMEAKLIVYREIIQAELQKEGVGKKVVSFDKDLKSFFIDGDKTKKISLGEIISAQRLGFDFRLPKKLNQFEEGQKLIEMMAKNLLFEKFNKELALVMSENTKHKDAFISKAYSEIAKRADNEGKSKGIEAEGIVLGFLERITIDHPDFGITVTGANAHEDVEDKIDFIINQAEHIVRGVGINRSDFAFEKKSIGIQFTINTSAREKKLDQINKAKLRGVQVDDIIYVDIDQTILGTAIKEWKLNGKKMTGPFEYLPKDIKNSVIKNLLKGMITEEQEKSF